MPKKRKKSLTGYTPHCWTKHFKWDKKFFEKGQRVFIPFIEKEKNTHKVRITIEEL